MKIIGGIFPLPDIKPLPEDQQAKLPTGIYTANARCGLYLINRWYAPSLIWLPDFLCPKIIDSFENVGIRFYKTTNLQADLSTLMPKPGEIVLAIDYYGFPTAEPVLAHARNLGVRTIQDCSQSLINTPYSSNADFIIYSLRKQLPVPDGGIVIQTKYNIYSTLKNDPRYWAGENMFAMEYRKLYEDDNATWYRLFTETKNIAPVGPFRMHQYTSSVLTSLNLNDIATQRKDNYRYLYFHLQRYSLTGRLPDHVSPSGFPIVLDNRDAVQQHLADHKIFCPIEWKCYHPLSDKVLIIPCDQRYDEEDMERIIQCLDKLLQK